MLRDLSPKVTPAAIPAVSLFTGKDVYHVWRRRLGYSIRMRQNTPSLVLNTLQTVFISDMILKHDVCARIQWSEIL